MKYFARIVLVTVFVASLAACSSRYRRDLFLVEGAELNKVKVEKTEFVIDGILGDPQSDEKVVAGPGNCVILTTGSRGETTEGEKQDLVGYDRYVRYKVFLQLPSRLQVGELPLENNSFVQLLGFYEIPPEQKMYMAQSGRFAIDSLTDKQLFGSIDGTWENSGQQPVTFRGEFKVKISR